MDWEDRLAQLWATFDDQSEHEFAKHLEQLVAELPPESAIAAYERGSLWDSTGHSDRAVPFYREALRLGLDSGRRRQAVIQLASSLRNMGEVAESVALLTAERDAGSDELDDAVGAFLALALVDSGREREAVSLLLKTLAHHMTRYKRSVNNYAELLVSK